MKALELGCSTITFTFERSQRITFRFCTRIRRDAHFRLLSEER